MHTIAGVVLAAAFAFVGTMVDNYFAFAAQLMVTERTRVRRVSSAQALAVAFTVALAAGLGSVLAPIPLRWIGVLCLAPFAFALHAFRQTSAPRGQFRRGALTTFALTLALGGDNLAVWIPLFRATGLSHVVWTLLTFALLEVFFLFSAQRVASHARVVSWGNAHAPALMPYLYVALGVLILFECHTI